MMGVDALLKIKISIFYFLKVKSLKKLKCWIYVVYRAKIAPVIKFDSEVTPSKVSSV